MEFFSLSEIKKDCTYIRRIYIQKDAIQSFRHTDGLSAEVKLESGDTIMISETFERMKYICKEFITLRLGVRYGKTVLIAVNPKHILAIRRADVSGSILTLRGSIVSEYVLEDEEEIIKKLN